MSILSHLQLLQQTWAVIPLANQSQHNVVIDLIGHFSQHWKITQVRQFPDYCAGVSQATVEKTSAVQQSEDCPTWVV